MESALAEGFAAGAGTAAQVLGPYFLCFALLGCAALALRKGVRRRRSGTRRRHGTRGAGRGGIGFALSLLLALILLKLLPLALVLALLLALLLAFYFKAGSLGASVGGGAAGKPFGSRSSVTMPGSNFCTGRLQALRRRIP